jgi:hypothetical protein
MRTTLSLIALLLPAFAAHAQYAPQTPSADDIAREQAQQQAWQAYTTRVATALGRSDAARDLAFAAILDDVARQPAEPAMPSGDTPSRPVEPAPASSQAARWRQAATQKAGQDVLANQLLIASRRSGDAPARTEAARRWQALEPQNLAPLMFQGLGIDALLAAARTTTHSDLHMYDSVRWMQAALLRHPPTAVEQRALTDDAAFHADEYSALSAMGLWSAFVMPAYQTLTQACEGSALRANASRAADCRHVAQVLVAQPSTALEHSIGLGMQRNLATTAAERAQADAARRRLDWQMQQWGRVSSQAEREGAAQFARLLADPTIKREQQLVERVLQEAAIVPDPPAGWRSPWQGR